MTSEPRITYIGHATVLIEMNGVRIITDPLLRNRVAHIRRQSDRIDHGHLDNLDAVLISHMHYDHLDLPSLRRLGRGTRIITPAGAGQVLHRDGFYNVEELREGDVTHIGDVSVDATYAHHDGFRHPFSHEADTLGYHLNGDASVYFAGDTDIFPEMSSIGDGIDLALLPVWGWGPTLGNGHLTPRRAAESLQLLRPRAAMPIHWGTFAPMGFGWLRPSFLTAPPHDFANHATDLAPDVNVHVVQPGDNLYFVN